MQIICAIIVPFGQIYSIFPLDSVVLVLSDAPLGMVWELLLESGRAVSARAVYMIRQSWRMLTQRTLNRECVVSLLSGGKKGAGRSATDQPDNVGAVCCVCTTLRAKMVVVLKEGG